MLAPRSRGAWGRSKRGLVNDRGPVIFSARSARCVSQRAYATCPTKRMPARRTVWRTPDVPQVCDGAAPLASHQRNLSSFQLWVCPRNPLHKANTLRSESCSRRIREAKDAWFKRWRLSDIRRRLGLPSYFSAGRTHASYALIPRIGSKGPWLAASVDFTKREAGVVKVTCIITGYRHGAGPVPSAQAGALACRATIKVRRVLIQIVARYSPWFHQIGDVAMGPI
jgi:hypothetical protein